MGKIKDKYIDMVKSRVDICQLVVDLCPGTTLKPSGTHRKKCCCVFHNESTPSLMLDTTLNRYKCFGCGKSGDVISFVEEVQGVDFVAAVHTLLDMYCPDVDAHDLFEQNTPEQEELHRKTETMYIYNQFAQEFFLSQYEADNEEAAECRRYAELSAGGTRGRWDKDFCRAFGLGYSPMRGNKFLEFAKNKGLDLKILAQIGLLGEDENRPGNYYDFYRGRLMIPQRDRWGRVQTFTARSFPLSAVCRPSLAR